MAKKRRRKRFSPMSLSNNGSDFLKDWEEENNLFNYNMFFGNQWKPEKLAKENQASSYAVSYNIVQSNWCLKLQNNRHLMYSKTI